MAILSESEGYLHTVFIFVHFFVIVAVAASINKCSGKPRKKPYTVL